MKRYVDDFLLDSVWWLCEKTHWGILTGYNTLNYPWSHLRMLLWWLERSQSYCHSYVLIKDAIKYVIDDHISSMQQSELPLSFCWFVKSSVSDAQSERFASYKTLRPQGKNLPCQSTRTALFRSGNWIQIPLCSREIRRQVKYYIERKKR